VYSFLSFLSLRSRGIQFRGLVCCARQTDAVEGGFGLLPTNVITDVCVAYRLQHRPLRPFLQRVRIARNAERCIS